MSVTDAVVGYAWWSAPAYSADGQYTAYNLGNGLTTVNQYDAATGLIQGISTGVGTGSAVQYLTYQYDTLGNLKQRVDGNQANLTENFGYDNLNRMHTASVGTSINKTVNYDSLGNITSKSDVGTYTYDPLHVHAVKTAGSGSYTYDANGNQKTGPNGRVITYNSFNQPTSIIQNGKTYTYAYDPDHLRTVETAPDGLTIFMHPRMDTGARFEWVRLNSGVIELKHFIYAGKEAIALYTTRSNNINDLRYFHKDHLGSIDTLTNDTGQVVERLSYDAWGKRRNGNWTDATTAITSLTHHGFTGHEHLDDIGLINMNGRIYDPMLGRFISADPTVQSPGNPQTLNRYSYANNNPLSYTDPSGYFSWRKFFGYATFGIFGGNSSTVRNIETGFACATGNPFLCGAATAANAYVSGASVEQSLKAGAIAGTTAEIFNQVGDYGHAQGWAEGSTNMIIAHSIAGGVTSVLQGGKFGPGALSAGFSEFAGPRSGDWGGFEVVKRSVLGGTASVMGGGKFANGAITAAFAYVYNDQAHHAWDNLVDKYVNAYNNDWGYKPGDAEYLDRKLIKAMITVESGNNMRAYNSDPMQVNNPGDWVNEKANYGLSYGVAPGPDLSIRAGIGWLTYKAYTYDSLGRDVSFRGWNAAVTRYNGGGDPNYANKVFSNCPTCAP